METQQVTDYLKQQIVLYFEAQRGRRIVLREVGKLYGLNAKTTRAVLDELVEAKVLCYDTRISGHGRFYFSPEAHERYDAQPPVLKMRSRGEYKPGSEWDEVHKRLAEFRTIKSRHL